MIRTWLRLCRDEIAMDLRELLLRRKPTLKKSLHLVKKIIHNPLTELATGLILLISGLATAYYEFTDAEHSFRLGVHHGVAVWALVQVLGSLPDLIDGIERSFAAVERPPKS